MELTPQTLHAVEFREARRGGYNTRDVDDFLERVAQGVEILQNRLRDAMLRAESSEGRSAEVHRQLEELQRRPPEVSETDDTLRRTLVLAQRTADATIKESKDEAARLLSEAREEAARVRAEFEAEARRGTEGTRAAAEAEIERLLDTRDSLKRDLEALGDRMRDQRERIRSGIAELEKVIDDPDLLQPVAPVPLTQVENPGQTGRHTRVELPAPLTEPTPNPAPAQAPGPGPLPMRNPAPHPGEPGPGGNGYPREPAVPFLPGSQVASLQEAPPLPSRPRPADLAPAAPAAQPAPFAFNGGGAPEPPPNVSPAPWPSQLRTSLDDEPAPVRNGHGGHGGGLNDDPRDGVGIEPGSRPSEWGRPVFDRDDDSEPSSRLGR